MNPAFCEVIKRATAEPAFRGLVIWFPEEVIKEYGLKDNEARAVLTGDLSNIDLDEEMLQRALWVFDLHDLHSGE
jgi:hypothetical protein